MSDKKLVGLSLSFCVKDILQGKVKLEDVDSIVAGTRARTDEDWIALLSSYSANYWYDFSQEEIKAVVDALKVKGIDQPRVRDEEPPQIYNGYWVDKGRMM